jgi:glycerol 2-dehydrogenase (NADP+)
MMFHSTLGGAYDDHPNEIFTHPLFKRIAASHDCSVGVVSLSWAVQRGITIIPKSTSDARVAENIRLVELSEDEMNEMNNAHKTIKQIHLVDWITAIQGKRADGTQLVMGWTKEDFGWEDKEGNWLP